jgi:hypothetical protein
MGVMGLNTYLYADTCDANTNNLAEQSAEINPNGTVIGGRF